MATKYNLTREQLRTLRKACKATNLHFEPMAARPKDALALIEKARRAGLI